MAEEILRTFLVRTDINDFPERVDRQVAESVAEIESFAAKRVKEECQALVEALKSARGSMGYGPLETMPSTNKRVREILDNAIEAHRKRMEKQ